MLLIAYEIASLIIFGRKDIATQSRRRESRKMSFRPKAKARRMPGRKLISFLPSLFTSHSSQVF